MRDLRGKIVLITGGGSGIGRLLCVQFAKEGARVVTVDLRQNFLDETASIVEKETQQRITTYLCDLANRAMIYEVAAKIKAEVGKVDVLVNNAVRFSRLAWSLRFNHRASCRVRPFWSSQMSRCRRRWT